MCKNHTLQQCVCVLQESVIGDAQSLLERKKKAGGVKEMLQDAIKLTHRIRFLVEEVRHSPCMCVFCVHPVCKTAHTVYSIHFLHPYFTSHLCMPSHPAAPAHNTRCVCVVAKP